MESKVLLNSKLYLKRKTEQVKMNLKVFNDGTCAGSAFGLAVRKEGAKGKRIFLTYIN